jgi:hypothetical protein
MLTILYIIISIIVALIVLYELFREKEWRTQLALAIILIPLLLRIFMVK